MSGHTTNERKQQPVDVDEIIIDRRFQVRNNTDTKTVKAYANAMKAGSEFPPVTLADIDGRLFLIDGFHRYEAALSVGCGEIQAIIVKMTDREALRASAVANLTHGLRLTKNEKIKAFKQFIKGGGHLNERGRLKSYREIATELHGIAAYTTIRTWMMKYFPRIAKMMTDEKIGNRTAEIPKSDPERERARLIREKLREVRTLLEIVSDPEEVFDIRELLKSLMVMVNQKKTREPDF